MKTNDGIMKEMMEEERVQFFIEIVLSLPGNHESKMWIPLGLSIEQPR